MAGAAAAFAAYAAARAPHGRCSSRLRCHGQSACVEATDADELTAALGVGASAPTTVSVTLVEETYTEATTIPCPRFPRCDSNPGFALAFD